MTDIHSGTPFPSTHELPMGVLPVYMSVYHVHVVPKEVRQGHQIPWKWSYRWLLAAIWVLGTELLRSSGRTPSVLAAEASLWLPCGKIFNVYVPNSSQDINQIHRPA